MNDGPYRTAPPKPFRLSVKTLTTALVCVRAAKEELLDLSATPDEVTEAEADISAILDNYPADIHPCAERGNHPMTTLAINPFVLRQTPESQYGHFDGDWSEVRDLILDLWEPLARFEEDGGIAKVTLPTARFQTSVVDLRASLAPLDAKFTKRRAGEDPYLEVTVGVPTKWPARYVEAVCFSHERLILSGDASSDAAYELISLTCGLDQAEPMHPLTMARNYLGKPGGSTATYTAKQFAEAVYYWSQHAMRRGDS